MGSIEDIISIEIMRGEETMGKLVCGLEGVLEAEGDLLFICGGLGGG